MTDHALDALLAEYLAPPVPAGLAGRVAAAALALPQEPRLAYARRAAAMPRHDRRGKWLRRPLLIGGVALGLAVSGAVAATLAGLRVDWPAVEELLADLPFISREGPADSVVPPPAAPPPAPPAAEPAPVDASSVASRADQALPAPPVPAARDEAPDPAPPGRAPAPADGAEARLIDARPAMQPYVPSAEPARPAPPAPPAERQETSPAPLAETRPTAPSVDEVRLRQERIERAERLRAARQAQIERLQRVQQRRERLRRLRRE